MEEIEALVAAGGAVCELCKGQMLKADGCTWPGIYCKGKYYKRIRYGDERRHWRDERCHDCGAKRGAVSSCKLRGRAMPGMWRPTD